MLSIARRVRGPCRRGEAHAARAALETTPAAAAASRRSFPGAGIHLLRFLQGTAGPTSTPRHSSSQPPLAIRHRRSSLDAAAGATMAPRPPHRAITLSATARGADVVAGQLQSSNETDVRAAGGGEGQEEGVGGFHGLSGGVDDLLATGGEDEDDGDVDQSATAAEPGDEEASQSPKTKDPSVMRLSRRIARSGVASRREAERMVEAGVVMVNGSTVQTPALNVGPRDIVKVNVGLFVFSPGNRTDHASFGKALERPESHTPKLWMVHKMRNELVTRHDPEGRATVFDRLAKLKLPDTLMPVGRLDYNTEGLLLLTNDGDLARKMELPSSNIVRTYSVRVYGNITEEKLRAMRSGCTIEGVRYKGMFVRVEGGGGKGREGRNAWLTIECTEGKNRQIRKICKYLCLTVNRLARTRYGPFSLGKVRAGGVAPLEIPKAFMRRLEDGGGLTRSGGGGSSSGSGRRRVGPGPGNGMRREMEAGGMNMSAEASPVGGLSPDRNSSAGGRGWGGGFRGTGRSWGGKRGPRIRKGVGAPMSRGDNSARPTAQQRTR
ncbi:unnamed protein product [Ectocarpus fasciculatus]